MMVCFVNSSGVWCRCVDVGIGNLYVKFGWKLG